MDKEEKKLADAYDRGLLKTENPSDDLLAMLKQAGEKTFKKDKRINIRLSSHDLIGIQPVSYTHLTLPTNREV